MKKLAVLLLGIGLIVASIIIANKTVKRYKKQNLQPHLSSAIGLGVLLATGVILIHVSTRMD